MEAGERMPCPQRTNQGLFHSGSSLPSMRRTDSVRPAHFVRRVAWFVIRLIGTFIAQ
jgi:hypothetical protein